MNPDLARLHPYPFEKLAELKAGITPTTTAKHIALSIGEPQHAPPAVAMAAMAESLGGLARYPLTRGERSLRVAIADWLTRRFRLNAGQVDPDRQVLPVAGTREALFSFAQAVVARPSDPTAPRPLVLMPNPFYQIYEGAALLAGATPYFLNTLPEDDFALNFGQLPEAVWQCAQLVYVCSPGNPTGHVMPLQEWQTLFEMSDRYGFIIASDECYSEIYFGDGKPLGALQAAQQLGRGDYKNLVVFSSLSKRSNVPGMRSGFVAGDAAIIAKFMLYRTYHGCAMNPAVQAASAAAWSDEAHVAENRRLYAEKFAQVAELLQSALPISLPDAGFYLWIRTPVADTVFAQALYRDYNVAVLPGSYLARTAQGVNPGEHYVRLALVANLEEAVEATQRIASFASTLN